MVRDATSDHPRPPRIRLDRFARSGRAWALWLGARRPISGRADGEGAVDDASDVEDAFSRRPEALAEWLEDCLRIERSVRARLEAERARRS